MEDIMTARLRGHQSSDHTSRVKLRLSTRSTTSSMAMKIHTIVAPLLVLLAVITESDEKPTVLGSRQIRGKDTNVARSYFFDVELVELLTREQPDKNVVLSPISIKLLLGMLMEGAGGETREQIRRALRLGKNHVEARQTVKNWVEAFKAPAPNSTLNLGSHIFVSDSYKINPNYEKIVQINYDGDVSSLDMSDSPKAADVINQWVKAETRGVIKKLVDQSQIPHDTYGIMTSAVYFKGSWKKPFMGKAVRCFYKTENKCTNTFFMQKRDTLMYAHISSINADVIELPYKDERFSLMVLIPRDSVEELNRDLPREQLHRVLAAMKPADLHIQMPRFTAEFKIDLVPALSQLQIKDAFSKSANIPGILEGVNHTFSVSHMLHSAKVVVDEEGSEAAAATEALIAPLIGVDSVIADKPFIFFIKDSLSNAILFAGRVSDPEQAVEPIVDHPVVQEVSPGLNNINEDVIVQRFPKPGTPSPLGPRKPGRPNGFFALSPSINFEDTDSGYSQPAKPTRSITTTTPPPFIRQNPNKGTTKVQLLTTTMPPPFIRTKPTVVVATRPTTQRTTTTNEPSESSESDDSDDKQSFSIRFYPFRLLWYRSYGIDESKTKKAPERFLFSS